MSNNSGAKLQKAQQIVATVDKQKKHILHTLEKMSIYKDILSSFFAKSYVLTLFSQYKSKKTVAEPVAVIEGSLESKKVKTSHLSSSINIHGENDMMNDIGFIDYLSLHGDQTEYKEEIRKVMTAYRLYYKCLSSINKDYKVILENVKTFETI